VAEDTDAVSCDLWVAPIGTDPAPDLAADGWRHVGAVMPGTPLTFRADPVPDDAGLEPFTAGGTVTVHLAANRRQLRQMARLFRVPWRYLRSSGPPPLAPGCLPATRRRRRRG
jgi:hypothetical protein